MVDAGAGPGGAQPPMPKMTGMLIALVIMMGVMMFNEQIGKALNYVLNPIFGFGGSMPVITLVLAGIFMTGVSTIIRALMSDMVKQTKTQHEQRAFTAELRQARIENNMYKIKKLQAIQQQQMAKSMEGTSAMMKTMPITMLIVIPIYAWVRYFVANVATYTNIIFPWGVLDISGSIWYIIAVYTLITIPFGQILNRAIRSFEFKKRLKELDAGTDIEVL